VVAAERPLGALVPRERGFCRINVDAAAPVLEDRVSVE
jgi:hypothetical protein